MITLKKQVKWRKDKKAIFICDCKRLIDLKLDFKYEDFIKKLSQGIQGEKLIKTENLIFEEFKKMKLLTNLEIKKLEKKDFSSAMNILDEELGIKRVRDSAFLKKKFKKFSDYFIGIYVGGELAGVVCGFPRENYLLMSEISVDFKFQRRKFGKKLVSEFEKIGFKKYTQINVGALNPAIEFYKSLSYKPFLLVQFEKETYSEKDFSKFKIISMNKSWIELAIKKCNLKELNKLRKIYPKANLQYIFTKTN